MQPNTSNASRPLRAGRRWWLLVLGTALAIALAAPAAVATPLSAFGDHTGEDHSFDDHSRETLNDIILASATLVSIDFQRSILTNALLTGADLTDARLDRADLTGAILSGANLTEARFDRAVFAGADFSGALLSDARGRRADFSGASFDGAVLTGFDVDRASFAGASLLGADLRGIDRANSADFVGATYNAATQLDSGFDTTGMVYVPEPLLGALLLTGAIALGRARRAARAEG